MILKIGTSAILILGTVGCLRMAYEKVQKFRSNKKKVKEALDQFKKGFDSLRSI